MKNLVVACGIQHAYLHPEGSKYLGERVDVLDTRLRAYFETLRNSSGIVYIVREVHQPNDSFYSDERTQSVVGSRDIQIPEYYKAHTKLIINSSRHSAFHMTPLESEIHKLRPDRVTLVGVETHTLILFTAEELRNRDYKVTVIEPLLLAQDDYLHAMGITLMRNFLKVDIEE